jgi:hypothetical protein
MPKPRQKSNLNRELPWRMYKIGLAYRIVNLDGSKIPLGRDREIALRRYYVIMARDETQADPLCVRTMWRRHQKGAKQRGLVFTISAEDVAAVLEDQGRVCAVTGLPFRSEKPEGMRIRPWAASLDRIDGKRGYEPGNIRVVCAFVNVAMNGFGELFFQQVLEPLIDAAVKARMFMSENGESAACNPTVGTALEYAAVNPASYAIAA